MADKIFHLTRNGQLMAMTEQSYNTEDILQRYLAEYPDLLAGDQINTDSPRRWLLVDREFAVPDEKSMGGRWSLDHLFLDQDGIPTLVEVKRSSDTRIRREIVGQMMDYAANASAYWSIADIRARFEARNSDHMTRLQEFLDYDDDAETFWERVATHLDTGKLRLIFVADIIPYELKRIIEFLNEQMNPAQVLGVEIKQYVGQEGLTSLVPRVIGQTTVAQQRKSSSTKKPSLTEAMFFDTIPSEMKEPAYRILDWAKQRMTRIDWGSSSFTPILTHKGLEYRIVSLYTSGSLEIKFEHLLNKPPFDDPQTRRQVFAAINNIVSLKHDDIDARPSFQYAELQGDNIDRFISILDEFVALVRMEN